MSGHIYQQLLDFITEKRQMRMSHIYQSFMLTSMNYLAKID